MTKKSNLLIISLLITIALFIYLTVHHFALKLGLGGNSLCEINSKINCDVAATSSFAELAGIPIAILGGMFHLVLLSFILSLRLDWVESTKYAQKTIRAMLLSSVAVSVVLGGVSLFVLKVVCPFCVGTYVFSFINLFLGWNVVQNLNGDFKFTNYFGEYKSHLITLLCVPALSWVVSGMIQNSYGLDQIKQQIPEKLSVWANSPAYSFDKNIGLSNGVANPRITLVEFADFKCPHCKSASNAIDIFLKGKTDILFTYKPYPLDGNCNPAIQQKGDNSRCVLAAYALCAEKIAKKGWDMHHWIFEKQERLFNVTDAKTLLPEIQNDLGLDKSQMADCADSAEIYDVINKSTQEGTTAKVEGTPTVYMNGKKLPWGQFLEVLNAAAKQAGK